MKKSKSFLLVIGLIIITLIVLGIALKIKLSPNTNYSIVYLNNGWLYYNNDNHKLGRGTLDTVKYSQDRNKFLYKLENDLYLHEKNKETKIAAEIKKYDFANDDKVIVYVNIDNKLSLYLNKKNIEISKDIQDYLGIYNNKIYFYKNSELYEYEINKQKSKSIIKNIFSVQLKENKIIYIDKQNTLNIYDLKTNQNITNFKNVNNYQLDDNLSSIAYIDNENNLHFYQDKKEHQIDENVHNIISTSNYIIYTKIENNDIKYYISNGQEKKLFEIKSLNTCLTSSNMYCLTSDGILYSIDNNLKINKLADKIYDDIYKYNSEFYVIGMKDNQNNLYKIKNNNIEEVDSNIASSSIKVVNDKLFYLKAKDKNYDLYRYDGQKSILLREKINKFYIIDKNIYLLKDYNEEDLTGSLYLYNEKEDKLLITKVTDLK